jgi:peptidase YpeB-like protein
MKLTRRYMIAGGAVLALAAGGLGAANAFGGGGDDEQATGPAADRARDAALALFPGGRANSVERDSEDGATWEVEVTRADGKTVDVRLDAGYGLVVVEGDGDGDGDGER